MEQSKRNSYFRTKTENYNKTILGCKEKIKEYKLRINMLEKKNNDLNNTLKKFRLNTVQNNNDINDNNHNDSYNYITKKKNYFNLNNNYFTKRNEPKYGELSKKHFNKHTSPFIPHKRQLISNTEGNINFKNNFTNNRINNDDNNNQESIEDQLDVSLKKYLENYRTFLSCLDEQINN